MTLRVSSLVKTVGKRLDFLARIASTERSSGILSTSRHREQGTEHLILGRRRPLLIDSLVC
jgi:hypothetical protein